MGKRQRILGIDLGIASCGWAFIELGDKEGGIVGLGTRCFDAPETDKERTPSNQLRRQHRGQRRVIRRRRQRMNKVRALLHETGFLQSQSPDALKMPGLDPWQLRAQGLDRRLIDSEFAVALGHIARHRGFRSNSKRDRAANSPSDSSKMLKEIENTKERLGQWRTAGEMFARDEAYASRKRNRDKDYSRSILRADLEHEVRILFERQRTLGNTRATNDLQARFADIAFSQLPLADSEDKVGPCLFEPTEKRAARRAYSFELFRLLARLTSLQVREGRIERTFTEDELRRATTRFGEQKKMSFKTLRKLLTLPDTARFIGIDSDKESNDVAARTGTAAEGTATLRKIVLDAAGDLAWTNLLAKPQTLDALAAVLSFREGLESIRTGLDTLDLDPAIRVALMGAVERGELAEFSRAGHISAKAARAIIPHLYRGVDYSKACQAAGYNHAKRAETDLDSIANPIAQKALREAIKQVRAVVREFGVPDRIHVELAREVGKSRDERDEITRGIERRSAERDRLREELAGQIGRPPLPGTDELLRYELWKEQKGRCLYCDSSIAPNGIVASDNRYQIDHILPWSRFSDDSFVNKTLCCARCNQEKRGRTVFEWYSSDKPANDWDVYVERIEAIVGMKGRKKRNYRLKDAASIQKKFRSRNLNDTRYAARLLTDLLSREYPPPKGRRRIFARPGPLTDKLRRAWGIQDIKKSLLTGERKADDRHHALDALICAATTEGMLSGLRWAFRRAEKRGLPQEFKGMPLPWPGFVEDARTAVQKVFVSRAERRRARGEAHAATIRQVSERNGASTVYERKRVEALTANDLERIKDPERNAKLIASLKEWIDANKPRGRKPLSPKGDEIAKVRLATNKKPDLIVREGAVDRGEIVRVDVFRKANGKRRSEYFVIPIYPHQVADTERWILPPDKAVQAHTDETKWPTIDSSFEYLFGLHPMCYLEMTTSQGQVVEGYFRELNRNDAGITLSEHLSKDAKTSKIGSRTLRSLRKFTVDRLGRKFEVSREVRTWRGKACT